MAMLRFVMGPGTRRTGVWAMAKAFAAMAWGLGNRSSLKKRAGVKS